MDDDTEVFARPMQALLSSLDADQALFLGRALQDLKGRSIIHHFESDKDFQYPDFACGWIMSIPLLRKTAAVLNTNPIAVTKNFFTDPQYEVAKLAEMVDVHLLHQGMFCDQMSSLLAPSSDCVTLARGRAPVPIHAIVNNADVFVAVKTVDIYHATRLA